MAIIAPFRALRPRPELAAEVAAVPYDVVDRDEARELARGRPRSFLHVTKPEIDLDDAVDSHGDDVYRAGADALRRFVADGVLVRDPSPRLYAYALTWRGHTQTGVAFLASVREYQENVVRKHEHTRPQKENDRARHMEILGAQSGTVFLVHREAPAIAAVIARVTASAPVVDFVAPDQVRHRLWVIDDDASIAALVKGFAGVGPLYIADGHHRTAAAARVAAGRGEAAESGFLAVSFPVGEVRILPYNRVVRDLNGLTARDFLAAVRQRFRVADGKPSPSRRRAFGMFLDGAWHTLVAREGSWDDADPVARLDVSILQDQLLAPVLGIEDPRRDERIDFVGGIRGEGELERRVAGGWAVAFSLHATAMDDLLAIADAEQVMPPKSTWFEPKLRDGLVVHVLE